MREVALRHTAVSVPFVFLSRWDLGPSEPLYSMFLPRPLTWAPHLGSYLLDGSVPSKCHIPENSSAVNSLQPSQRMGASMRVTRDGSTVAEGQRPRTGSEL